MSGKPGLELSSALDPPQKHQQFMGADQAELVEQLAQQIATTQASES
jgi:hypothetical protein